MTNERINQIVSEAETLTLNDAARELEGGTYIKLPTTGITRYELKGEGKPMVMVHGYATPMFIYDKLFNFFSENGFKVLRYDLVGRGMSDIIQTDYSHELFARQLREITTEFFKDEKFILIGTSMGGSISAAFCHNYPGVVEKLILLAPAGMDNFNPPFYMKLCQIPGLGKKIFNLVGAKSLLNGCASELKYNLAEKDSYMEQFGYCMRYKDFVSSTFSSLVNTILQTKRVSKMYESIENQNIPLLVIWGTEDRTMPYYQKERLQQICPNGTYITYEGSGHIFLFDQGEKTIKDISCFIGTD